MIFEKWKKYGVFGASAVAALGFVVGCGTSGSSGSGGASNQPVTLKVMGWNIAEGTLQTDAKLYEKTHPNVHFQFVTEDNATDTETKYNAELAAGADVPDIMVVESNHAQGFLKKFPNSFLDLSDMMKPIASDFAQSKLPALTVNGKIYGVPWDVGPTLVFYRTDLFKQAGIDPSSIKTWDDYIAAGKKLTEHFGGKVKMAAQAYGDDTLLRAMLNEQGSYYFNANGDITINGTPAQKAVAEEQKMFKSGILMQVPGATYWNDTVKGFVNNEIASSVEGVWYVGTVTGSAADQSGKWGVFPMPAFTAGGNNAANLGGSNLMLSAKTKNPTVAEDFAKFCMTNNAALDSSLKNGLYPSYLPYLKDSQMINQPIPFFGNQKVYQVAAQEVDKIPPANDTTDFSTAKNYVQTGIEQVFSGQASISSALNAAANKTAQDSGRKIANNG